MDTPTHRPFQIAIDGPVAAGKGIVSRTVAEKLGFLYVDTGAMYRCVAYLAIQHKIPLENEEALLEELQKHTITLRLPTQAEKDGRLLTVLLDDQDVTWQIRTEQISSKVPITSQHLKIRQELIVQQQKLSSTQNVVMEGRDITSKVLPNAQIKIYLDASPQIRAQRRLKDLQTRGIQASYEEVLKEMQLRDEKDKEKNLVKVAGVWEIDTSDMTIQQVVDLIYTKAKSLMESTA